MSAVVESTAAPAPAVQPADPMQMLAVAIERGASMDQLQKLMELQERWERNQSRKAFDAAIAAAKAEIKPIVKKREVDFTTAKGRTNYKYEDFALIASEVDPILSKHGLSYRYRARQDGNKLTVTCILAHRDGHSEETELTAFNDESGNKNSIQGIGSAATYLQRYTLKLALGLAAAKDDDGAAAGRTEPPKEPDGYDDWRTDMEAVASEGILKLQEAWKTSPAEFRRYAATVAKEWWEETKAQAAKVQS